MSQGRRKQSRRKAFRCGAGVRSPKERETPAGGEGGGRRGFPPSLPPCIFPPRQEHTALRRTRLPRPATPSPDGPSCAAVVYEAAGHSWGRSVPRGPRARNPGLSKATPGVTPGTSCFKNPLCSARGGEGGSEQPLRPDRMAASSRRLASVPSPACPSPPPRPLRHQSTHLPQPVSRGHLSHPKGKASFGAVPAGGGRNREVFRFVPRRVPSVHSPEEGRGGERGPRSRLRGHRWRG